MRNATSRQGEDAAQATSYQQEVPAKADYADGGTMKIALAIPASRPTHVALHGTAHHAGHSIRGLQTRPLPPWQRMK